MRNVKKMLALLFGVLLLISCKNHNVHVMPANCDMIQLRPSIKF